MIDQPAISLQYIRIPVAATVSGQDIDPSSDTVKFAFMPDGTAPGSSDFHVGDWETLADGTTIARILVGPSPGITLTAGNYRVWIKITDSPEVPIAPVDLLRIY